MCDLTNPIFTDEDAAREHLENIHDRIHHAALEYVHGDVFTNTIEGLFSIFKRSMKGVYQHCVEHHPRRYLAEFDFRYNHRKISDAERAGKALAGITGKRLMYHQAG